MPWFNEFDKYASSKRGYSGEEDHEKAVLLFGEVHGFTEERRKRRKLEKEVDERWETEFPEFQQ